MVLKMRGADDLSRKEVGRGHVHAGSETGSDSNPRVSFSAVRSGVLHAVKCPCLWLSRLLR